MSLRHPELEAIARDLADLVTRGVSPDEPSIARAEDALREAQRAAAGDRGSMATVDAAIASARAAIDEARDLLPQDDEPSPPAPAPRQAHVELHSEIPDDHPAKPAIETAVAGAFAGVKGRWRVFILVQEKAPWWGLRVEGSAVRWTGTVEGPEEQSPEFLAGRVREAVQLGLMQSALSRNRGRDPGH
jgi:hypothetical protein